jgi:hypothetical protein
VRQPEHRVIAGAFNSSGALNKFKP